MVKIDLQKLLVPVLESVTHSVHKKRTIALVQTSANKSDDVLKCDIGADEDRIRSCANYVLTALLRMGPSYSIAHFYQDAAVRKYRFIYDEAARKVSISIDAEAFDALVKNSKRPEVKLTADDATREIQRRELDDWLSISVNKIIVEYAISGCQYKVEVSRSACNTAPKMTKVIALNDSKIPMEDTMEDEFWIAISHLIKCDMAVNIANGSLVCLPEMLKIIHYGNASNELICKYYSFTAPTLAPVASDTTSNYATTGDSAVAADFATTVETTYSTPVEPSKDVAVVVNADDDVESGEDKDVILSKSDLDDDLGLPDAQTNDAEASALTTKSSTESKINPKEIEEPEHVDRQNIAYDEEEVEGHTLTSGVDDKAKNIEEPIVDGGTNEESVTEGVAPVTFPPVNAGVDQKNIESEFVQEEVEGHTLTSGVDDKAKNIEEPIVDGEDKDNRQSYTIPATLNINDGTALANDEKLKLSSSEQQEVKGLPTDSKEQDGKQQEMTIDHANTPGDPVSGASNDGKSLHAQCRSILLTFALFIWMTLKDIFIQIINGARGAICGLCNGLAGDQVGNVEQVSRGKDDTMFGAPDSEQSAVASVACVSEEEISKQFDVNSAESSARPSSVAR